MPRVHAGRAGRGEMALGTSDAHRAGRGTRSAPLRRRGRSAASGACAGNVPRRRGDAARSLARAGGGWAAACRDPEPARHLGAHRHDAVRPRPALSRSQITALLRETWFTPTGWGEALYVPPIARNWFLRSAVAWERTGATLSAPFAGVHIVEATKQVYRAIPARRERRRLVPALEPVLAPSAPGAARSG